MGIDNCPDDGQPQSDAPIDFGADGGVATEEWLEHGILLRIVNAGAIILHRDRYGGRQRFEADSGTAPNLTALSIRLFSARPNAWPRHCAGRCSGPS